MDKLPFLQIDAYMGNLPTGGGGGEEKQVTRAQFVACKQVWTEVVLGGGVAWKAYMVDGLVELMGQSGAVYALTAVASAAIGGTYPFCRIQVELVVVVTVNVQAQAKAGMSQCAIVAIRVRSAA